MASSLPPNATTTLPSSSSSSRRKNCPPISISTNPSDIDPAHLRDLLHASNLSCHRFPSLDPNGRTEPVDLGKLRTALSHSSVVVSAFCRSRSLSRDEDLRFAVFESLFERAIPIPEDERRLVGFGRAVSDGSLTASIHDVVVIPSLQRLGIGRKIVHRLVRSLTSKDIYDISALCSDTERVFFQACGFGDDCLGSTTMIYTQTALVNSEEEQMVRRTGRMFLSIPPPLESYTFKRKTAKETGILPDTQNLI